jgi:ankyrin repeat protein
MLDMNCNPSHTDLLGNTALMHAFEYYGSNPNCNGHILQKLLDMNCVPEQANIFGDTALIYALERYGSKPNCNPHIFLKLILLLYPSITRPKLIEILDKNTTDRELKNNILGMYDYNRRRTIINNRVSKRVSTGKYDSLSIFD